MSVKLGVIMDPIEGITVSKDTTFAMLLEAQRRAWQVYYLQTSDLYMTGAAVMGHAAQISVRDDPHDWYELHDQTLQDLSELDVVLMRKDPPFDMEYLYATYLLERLCEAGTLVVNHPAGLRNANEKLFATRFAECMAPSVVARKKQILDDFIDLHGEVVVKPLDGMAGDSIFRIRHDDPNRNVILETITRCGRRTVMAQQFIAAYKQGDKRILLIDGVPVPHALTRIPAEGELRANLAKGGTAQDAELTARDWWICECLKPELIAMQLIFVGIDVIGDYLTEINVTSPTCVREMDRAYGLNICAILFDAIERRLTAA